MKEELADITEYTGQNLQLTVLEKMHFDYSDLKLIYDEIHPTSDDILLFYQSSHGFRAAEKIGIWPTLDYTSFQIDFETIVSYFSAKQPRLLIVIADVCNAVHSSKKLNSVSLEAPIDLPQRLVRLNEVIKKQGKQEAYQKLFNLAHGTILISSASPGQLSFSLFKKGSFFTSSLIHSIEKAAEGKIMADWSTVIRQAVKETEKNTEKRKLPKQTPQFQVF